MLEKEEYQVRQNPQETYRKGYADGLCLAEKMRWQGTPIGDLLRRFPRLSEQPDDAAYEEGFKQAMEDMGRLEWMLSK